MGLAEWGWEVDSGLADARLRTGVRAGLIWHGRGEGAYRVGAAGAGGMFVRGDDGQWALAGRGAGIRPCWGARGVPGRITKTLHRVEIATCWAAREEERRTSKHLSSPVWW